MKFLRGLANTILTIILALLILGLSMTFIIKKFVQDDLIVEMAKEEIVTRFVDSDKVEGLDEEKKTVIKDLLNEKDVNELLNLAMDNYILYTVSDNYELSKADYNKAFKFVESHLDAINKLTNENVDEEYIKEHFTYEEVNKYVKEGFAKLDSELQDSEVDTEEVTNNVNVINVYANIVSNQTRISILSAIGVVVLLLMVVNWSISKWMVEAGISLIISGAFVTMIYNLVEFLKDATSDDDALKYLTSIDIKYAIIIGTCEVIAGIAIIIIKSKIEKLEIENMNVEKQGTKENME